LRGGRRRQAAKARSASSPGDSESNREKYFETVRLARSRFAVAMIDWRGQVIPRGACGSAQGLCRDFSDFEVDVETFVQQVCCRIAAAVFRAGAFDGGAVMLRIAHAGKRWFDRMCCRRR